MKKVLGDVLSGVAAVALVLGGGATMLLVGNPHSQAAPAVTTIDAKRPPPQGWPTSSNPQP
ncbi:hypothetical protein [Alloactinosynnema sp. L-07]|nr:hypothetical protein [Alloactinosynnema sp. L-07]